MAKVPLFPILIGEYIRGAWTGYGDRRPPMKAEVMHRMLQRYNGEAADALRSGDEEAAARASSNPFM